MAEVSLELKEIKKSFTEGEAVLDNISLEISKGEFITLLGSSGCGKTTTLRIMPAGTARCRKCLAGRQGSDRSGAEPEGCEYGISELCALSAYECCGEYWLWPEAEKSS